jgi:hypothetical protein
MNLKPIDLGPINLKRINLKHMTMSLRFDMLFLVLALAFVGVVIAGRL